jgi:hypothetical protein
MHFDTRNPRLLVRRPTIREWKLLSQLAFCWHLPFICMDSHMSWISCLYKKTPANTTF